MEFWTAEFDTSQEIIVIAQDESLEVVRERVREFLNDNFTCEEDCGITKEQIDNLETSQLNTIMPAQLSVIKTITIEGEGKS